MRPECRVLLFYCLTCLCLAGCAHRKVLVMNYYCAYVCESLSVCVCLCVFFNKQTEKRLNLPQLSVFTATRTQHLKKKSHHVSDRMASLVGVHTEANCDVSVHAERLVWCEPPTWIQRAFRGLNSVSEQRLTVNQHRACFQSGTGWQVSVHVNNPLKSSLRNVKLHILYLLLIVTRICTSPHLDKVF